MVKSNGGIAMKTFPTYDNALCSGARCSMKETCVRYLTHLKAVKERYPYPIAYLMSNEEKECDMYVKAD